MKRLTAESIADEIRYYDPAIEVTDELTQRIRTAMTETPMSVPGYLTLVLEKAAGDVLDERAIYEISKNTAIEYASVFAESDLSEERQDPEDEDEDDFEM